MTLKAHDDEQYLLNLQKKEVEQAKRIKELEDALREVVSWYEHTNIQDAEMNRRVSRANKILERK